MSARCPGGSPRVGFTLLEVLLSLSLAVVLIGLVGGAIQFYAIEMNVRDMDIRQTQLASAVMQMIEDDLRATLHAEPVDTSGLEALLATTASNVDGGASAGAGSDSGGSGGGDGPTSFTDDLSAAGVDSTTPDEEMEEETEAPSAVDLQAGAAVLQTAGLIGNQYQIQVDLSRLPRLEEYVQMMDQTIGNLEDVPSDLKTVSYFVQPAGTGMGVQDPLSTVEADPIQADTGGLVRRSLDRAATEFAMVSGGSMMLNQTGELLAPEIIGIEFAYWDGLTWQMEWSSDQYGELPLAVQVRLHMADPKAAITGGAIDPTQTRTFMHVVRLPMARPISEEEDETLSEAGI